MAAMRPNPRLQVGSTPWIAEERSAALQIADAEVEEFSFAARTDVEWLNEHMADIFSKNQINVAEFFKTPGKLRGKTPRTVRRNPLETRAPLSDVFSATTKGGPSPFKQAHFERPPPTFQIAQDEAGPSSQREIADSFSMQDPFQKNPVMNNLDSGYYGSQLEEVIQHTQDTVMYESAPPTPEAPSDDSPQEALQEEEEAHILEPMVLDIDSPSAKRSPERSFQSAREHQPEVLPDSGHPGIEESAPQLEVKDVEVEQAPEADQVSYPVLESPKENRSPVRSSPRRQSPQKASSSIKSPHKQIMPDIQPSQERVADDVSDEAQSQSDGSSPIRPVVRKSSLNFASLPAREPLTSKKSIGAYASRHSQLDATRTSYYGRQTGGKSLGTRQETEANNADEMDVDEAEGTEQRQESDAEAKITRNHNKTSTQRLQDQISMLGQSQANARASKSISNTTAVSAQPSQSAQAQAHETKKDQSPLLLAPGAFPEDEDDSWIGPSTAPLQSSVFSPRPQLFKTHTAEVMENIRDKESVSGDQFSIPTRSPLRGIDSPAQLLHKKSASTSTIRSPRKAGDTSGETKVISVSNPTPAVVEGDPQRAPSPPKSPSRTLRGSPLKAAKDKFSSILKTSRGLFASSAAVSAEAKNAAMSPGPVSGMDLDRVPTFEDLLLAQSNDQATMAADQQSRPASPQKQNTRKTRASTEKEEKKKEDQAREAKEAKEQHKLDAQLEKARSKVKEDARVHHEEKERVAAMQKQVDALKEQEKVAQETQVEPPRATRSSPRKTKAQLEAEGIAAAAVVAEPTSGEDFEMPDTSAAMPPPPAPRPKSQIGRPAAKRPLRPAKDPNAKVNPPTVIRVDTGSQRGHQYHPSTSTLSATLQESLQGPPTGASFQGHVKNKASTSSIQSKASTSSFKATASKALEAARKKKEADEAQAQKKREQKLEIERKREAIREEERRVQEQQRKVEAERQREIQREREQAASLADAKKTASRQAMEKRRMEMEKAKQTRAPPPAARPQPGGELYSVSQDKALPPLPSQRNEIGAAKASRINPPNNRPQEDMGRSVNSSINSAKVPPKRPLQQEPVEDSYLRPTMARNGPTYQNNDAHTKRRKTSETFDNDGDMKEAHPTMTAPPIRQSSIRPKEVSSMATKSLFPSGYSNAPAPANLQRSTLISQHMQSKTGYPTDMAQTSKAPIAFAPGSSQAAGPSHKTPARPGAGHGGKSAAKSAAKSSPRYQNGESIDLPEIHTDSEDEDSDGGNDFVALGWTNSPEIRKQLALQETIDPAEVFGRPGPLVMEEVFSKSKDKFHKFRQRTSSANWSGTDKLTEDEVKKDLEARDRVRRQGGWTYDSMV